MDFPINPEQPTGAPVATSSAEWDAAWRASRDADLEKKKKEAKGDASKTATSTDDSFGKKMSRFFESLPSLKDTGRAIVRGAAEAINNQGKTLNDIAVAAGAMKPETAKPHGKDASFIEWFSKPASEEAIDETLGKRQEGVAGFIESAAQFATGMVGASKFIKPLGLASTAASAVAGGVADMSAFDPYQKRLSNMIQSGPSWLANPLTELLQADDDDSKIVARVKAGFEGLLTGYTVDRMIAGVKALRGAKKGVAVEAKALEVPKPTEPVVVKKVDDTFVVSEAQDAADPHGIPSTLYHGTNADFKEFRAGHAPGWGDGVYLTDNAEAASEFGNRIVKANVQLQNPYKGVPIPVETMEASKAWKSVSDKWESVEDAWQEDSGFVGRLLRELGYDGVATKGSNNIDGLEVVVFDPKKIKIQPDDLAFASEAEAESVASSMNSAIRISKQPMGTLSSEQVTQVQDVAKRLTEGPHVAADAQRMLEGTDFNFNYSQAPQDAKAVIEAISEALPEATTFMRGGVQTHAETSALAEGLLQDMDGDQVVEAVSKAFNNTEKLPQLITAARTYMYGVGKQIAQLSRAADAQPDNAVAFNELKKAMEHLWDVHANLAGTSSNVGRALDAHKIKVGAIDAVDETGQVAAAESHRLASEGALDGLTKPELRALARTTLMDEGDPSAILAAIRGTKRLNKGPVTPSLIERVNSFRIEAMLSGPKTQIVNAVNNVMAAVQMPTEYWWAGVRSGNKALRQQGSDQIAGLFLEARDSWRAAAKAFRTGTNALDEVGGIVQDTGVPQAPNMMNGLAKLAHLPSRMLLTTDEFFKTLSYRSNVRAQSLRLAREQGITDAGQLAQRVSDDMKAAFSLDGAATRPVSLEYARTATFQNPLEYGIGKWIQDGVQEHPGLRLVMPFVRTPVNLFRYAWQRTPVLGNFTREYKEAMKVGGERAAIAQAKTEMGMLAYSTAATLALSGNLTGSGPKNKELRAQWLAAGNQPYSVKIPGGGWVSYRRADPTMTPLGLVADLVSISGELHGDTFDEHASAIAAAIASNVSSKTFMQGLTETMDAMSSGDGFLMQKLFTNTVGSFVPNFLRQVNPDDTLRETRGMIDELMGRVPGLSDNLEPRRNILGEPIMRPPGYGNRTLNPFTFMKDPGDEDVQVKLLELGKAMSLPSERHGDVNLADRSAFDNGTGQSPYDRMLELSGAARDGHKSLRDELTELVKSPEWENASDGTEAIPGGRKYLMASRIITKAQDRAFKEVLREYPKLKQALDKQKQINRAAVRGGDSAVQEVERMFNP